MIPLPVANVLHHKLRSALSALGVGTSVCMLVTLTGLSRGSLAEVAERWEAVDADVIAFPSRWGDNITTISGGGLTDRDVRRLTDLEVDGGPAFERVVPVYIHRAGIAGKEHNVVGVTPEDLPHLLAGGRIRPGGRIFDPDNRFAAWLERKLTTPADDVVDISPAELARRGGLETVIDSRLAKAAGVKVNDTLYAAGHEFTVVGVVEAGALVRAFVPLATAQYVFGNGRLGRYTLMFAALRDGVPAGRAVEAVGRTRRLAAVAVGEYRNMLEDRFGVMYIYVDAVNAVTLVVAFLFILVTLYTMVLQRTREIAILKSMGASRGFMLGEVLCESLILTACGTAAGVAMSFAAAGLIQWLAPLLTVTIAWQWVLRALAAAGVGGTIAAVYPAWCAMRVDVAEAMNVE